MSILKTQKDEQEYKEMHNDLFYLLYETYQTYYTLLHYDNFISKLHKNFSNSIPFIKSISEIVVCFVL